MDKTDTLSKVIGYVSLLDMIVLLVFQIYELIFELSISLLKILFIFLCAFFVFKVLLRRQSLSKYEKVLGIILLAIIFGLLQITIREKFGAKITEIKFKK